MVALLLASTLATVGSIKYNVYAKCVDVYNNYSSKTLQDTSKLKNVALPEVAVAGVKSVQFIGLGQLKHNAGLRGVTGDRIAVYIAHPATTANYEVTTVTLDISNLDSHDFRFAEGELDIRLCRAVDAGHAPLDSLLAPELVLYPQTTSKKHRGYLELPLAAPIVLPEAGLFVVAAWKYRRNAQDEKTRAVRSAELATTWALAESYTWTSVGDMKQTWQREGEKNSMTDAYRQQGLYKDKVYNALMGVKVKQVD